MLGGRGWSGITTSGGCGEGTGLEGQSAPGMLHRVSAQVTPQPLYGRGNNRRLDPGSFDVKLCVLTRGPRYQVLVLHNYDFRPLRPNSLLCSFPDKLLYRKMLTTAYTESISVEIGVSCICLSNILTHPCNCSTVYRIKLSLSPKSTN